MRLDHRRTLLIWAGFALAVGGAPLLFSSSLGLTVLSQICTVAIITLSYNLMYGQTGMLSFGHAVQVGLGAYVAAHTLKLVAAHALWFPVSLTPLAGGLAGAAFAVLSGYLATRKSGMAFAMITLGIGELVAASALMFPGFFGGEAGVAFDRVIGPARLGLTFGPQVEVYYLIAAWLLVCAVLMALFTATPLGRLANAVRDNAERVAYIGYDPRHVRFLVTVVAGFFAGVAGALSALNFEIVSAENVGTARSGAYLLFTVIGGAGFFFGPVLGAIVYALGFLLLSELTRAWLLYMGLFFLAMVVYAPGGLAGLIDMHWRLLRAPRWPAMRGAYLRLLGALAVLCFGMVVLIEMAYRLHSGSAGQRQLMLAGVVFDLTAPWPWLGAALAALLGVLLLRMTWPVLASAWQGAAQQPAARERR